MMPLRAGSVFAKAYEIVRPISAGGMGVVYEVIHLGTRRKRALKIMLAHIVSDPKMRERFTLEAVVTADIESEHLTEVFDAGIDSETDCPYLVMELLRGEDLGARLKRGERTTAQETMVLMDQVAHALEKTHAQGVVHRDLKPDNIFLTHRDDGSPRIKILDFGIAKLVKQDLSGPQATTKTFGTPYYMAREQITGESALIGPASDAYAVAHIVFALLTGRPYFEDEAKKSEGNVLALLMAVGQGASERAVSRALRRGVELPPAFDAWFERATAQMPGDRFPTVRAMIEALGVVLRDPVRIVGADAGAVEPPKDGVSATSNRMERSYPTPGGADSSNPELFHQTGGPQSITAQVPKLPQKRGSRALLWVAGGLVAGVAVGVAAWRLTAEQPNNQAGAMVVATATQAATGTAEKSASGPVVAPGTTLAASVASDSPSIAVGSAVASAASSAASVSTGGAVPAPGTARPTAAKPAKTSAAAAAPPVWETR